MNKSKKFFIKRTSFLQNRGLQISITLTPSVYLHLDPGIRLAIYRIWPDTEFASVSGLNEYRPDIKT